MYNTSLFEDSSTDTLHILITPPRGMNRSCRQSSPCKHQPCWLNMTICSSFRSDRSLNPLHVNRGRAKSKRGHMQWEVTSSNEITYNDESNRIGTREGTCNERSHPVIKTRESLGQGPKAAAVKIIAKSENQESRNQAHVGKIVSLFLLGNALISYRKNSWSPRLKTII